MSTQKHTPTFDWIASCDQLDCILRRRLGVSFRTYKLISAVTKLIAVIVGGGTLVAGADATIVVIVVGTIVAGPDLVEALVANSGGKE